MEEVFPGPCWSPSRRPVRLIHRGPWSDTIEAARDDGDHRRVAVKLASVAGREELAERWVAVSEDTRRRLEHRHVVSILETRIERGWLIAERAYVDGVDVGAAARTGETVPLDAACAVGRAVFDAVCAARAAGVVAGRVSPSHVLVGRDGGVGVLSVGLPPGPVRADPDREPAADPETGFAPPEAFTGGGPSAEGDVYSAAAVVHLLLTGRVPAPESHRLSRVLLRRGAAPLGPETVIWPERPLLSRVLGAALSVVPGERPPPGEVAEALAREADDSSGIAAWTRMVVGSASMPPAG